MASAVHTTQELDIFIDGAGVHTIVMVHGWPDTCRLWDATVQALKANHRCVRFTLPGFDITRPARATTLAQMSQLLSAIVDAVSPDRPVTLLLHDWGCVFGYEFAACHPGRVARIVAVDIGDHNSAALRQSLGARAKWQVFAYQFWLAVAWKLGSPLGNRMTRWMARWLRCRTEPSTIGAQMNYSYAMKWFGTLGGLGAAAQVRPQCPTLYVYGARKPFMFHSPLWLEQLAAQPGCAVQAFATGHWVMVQQPQAFHACLAAWLSRGAQTTR